MLNFSRGGDRPHDPHDSRNAGKPALRPAAIYEPPGSPATTASRALPPDPASLRDGNAGAARSDSPHASAPPPAHAATAASADEEPGSKLCVGVNVKLKGVEISDCDLLVVEGHVEATVHSKQMQITKPGTLHGTALVEVAEVHGEFTGELTARTRLVVHGTGKVSGTIRYGRLIVADGGTISGDMKQIDAVEAPPAPPARQTAHAAHDSRHSAASRAT